MNLWHHRLNHSSNNILHYISNMFSYIHFDKNKAFESCHIAKQQKLLFNHSSNDYTHILGLIPIDI